MTVPLNISWVRSLVLRASMFRMGPSHDWQVDSGCQIRTWPGLWFFFMWNSHGLPHSVAAMFQEQVF